MSLRHRNGVRVLGAGLAALLTVGAFAACGSSSSGDKTTTGGGGGGKTGGTITILGTSFPDYLDPALSYTVDGWEAHERVYPGLVDLSRTWSGQDGAKAVPGLAEDCPRSRTAARPTTSSCATGLKFSDGTPIKASDFKHSIERILAAGLPGLGLGYTSIVGAEEFLKTKKGGITGIKVDDATGAHHDRADQAARPVPLRARDPVRGVVPSEHARQEHDQEPAARARAAT